MSDVVCERMWRRKWCGRGRVERVGKEREERLAETADHRL